MEIRKFSRLNRNEKKATRDGEGSKSKLGGFSPKILEKLHEWRRARKSGGTQKVLNAARNLVRINKTIF